MPLSLSRLLAAPTVAGLLFLLPPSIAQPNSGNSTSSWSNFIEDIVKLFQNKDISVEELRNQIIKSTELIRNQSNTDQEVILDEIKELSTKLDDIETSVLKEEDLDRILLQISTKTRQVENKLAKQDKDLEEKFVKLNRRLQGIKNIITELQKEVGSIEIDIQGLKD